MAFGTDILFRDKPGDKAENGGNEYEESTGKTSTADIFRILANGRRRYAILFFLYYDPKPDLRDLSKQIAAWENQKPIDHVTTEERRRVYSALQQSHLPKMNDAGVIEYDSTQHTIESTNGIGVTQPYLEVVPGTSLPWCLYYLTFGGISVVLTTAAVINAIPIPGSLLAIVISIILVVSGTVHVHSERRRVRISKGHFKGED